LLIFVKQKKETMTETINTFTEKVEKTIETCMIFDGEKHILFENDIKEMFSWDNIDSVKETTKKIVALLNEKMISDKAEYIRLFDLEISELIEIV